jgi:hypothetical protein
MLRPIQHESGTKVPTNIGLYREQSDQQSEGPRQGHYAVKLSQVIGQRIRVDNWHIIGGSRGPDVVNVCGISCVSSSYRSVSCRLIPLLTPDVL